jgi:glycosyltransferase involved in cell wall biosynthesis
VAVIGALARIPRSFDLLYLHAGCEEEAATDRSLAARLRVEGRIRFLGPVLDIAVLLHAADLFLMPSLHEGFGIAAVEAMGAGLPVVLADVEGLWDLREIAPAGEWVKPEAGAIAAAILRFAELGESGREAIGRELSGTIRQHCAVEVGAGRYASLYGEMLRT